MTARPAKRRQPAVSTTRAGHAIRFIEHYCRLTKGRWAGEPFTLEPWQRDEVVAPLFGAIDREGRRRYREALIGLPRKNGKSMLASALALYLLIADEEPGAEVYSAAGDKNQARIVFKQAARMAQMSPELRSWCRIFKDVIEIPETGAIYRALSADAPLQHGLDVHAAVIDELHVHPNRDLYDALRTGTGARREPLVISITTAGRAGDRESVLRDRFDHGCKGRDPRFFFYWRTAPDGAPLNDLKAWRAANPASWRRSREAMREEINAGHPEPVFRRLFRNEWVSAYEKPFVPLQKWDACAGHPEIPARAPVWIAVDAALKRDSTGVSVVGRDGERLPSFTEILHADADTGVLDFYRLENLLREWARRWDVREIAYDPFGMARTAQLLLDENLPMVEFPQENSRMVPATAALYDAVQDGRLLHDGNAELRRHIEAAIAKETNRGWRLDKVKSRDKIDGAVSLAIALYRATSAEEPRRPARLITF